MKLNIQGWNRESAFTLVEVVIATSLATLTVSACIYGYILCAKRAEWSGYSLAANAVAMQRLEQTRASYWDPSAATTNNDQLLPKYFPVTTNNVLDLPVAGGKTVFATNYTSITTLSTNPFLKMIRVDCAWPFQGKTYTNTVMTYRAGVQ